MPHGEARTIISKAGGLGWRVGLCLIGTLVAVAAADPAAAQAPKAVSSLGQGWSEKDQDIFYTTSQGSRLMPYAWFRALRQLDSDEPFSAGQLQRYGYLPNPRSKDGLPVGFVIDRRATPAAIGMTCAACHTAELQYDGKVYRIDGGRTNADFQTFLAELTATARNTLASPSVFTSFAKAVLGPAHSPVTAATLKRSLTDWVIPFGDFMDASLPPSPWGPGRLDAFGMIFNRVTGLDLRQPNNRRPADAPVRYPFLWNAPIQDRTQWNGVAKNGLYVLGLGRNTGEVFGVFGALDPMPLQPAVLHAVRYDNSVDFEGLQTLEEKISVLQPPRWPFGLKSELLARGKEIFDGTCAKGCHEKSVTLAGTWRTPILPVKTDPRMHDNALLKADPGILLDTMAPPVIGTRLENPAAKVDILTNVVAGSLLQQLAADSFPPWRTIKSGVWRAVRKDLQDRLGPNPEFMALLTGQLDPAALERLREDVRQDLRDLYRPPAEAPPEAAYEARVLTGIWAVAPYLHNGSVPNLWELLKPAKDRLPVFMVGSREFDPELVGYVIDRSPFGVAGTYKTTPEIGNGNGGHEYGTDLSDEDRWKLIEYLKTL